MGERIVVVVGDKFSAFAADKDDVITVSQLKGLLALPSVLVSAAERLVLVPGQGLAEEDIAMVMSLAFKSPHQAIFDLSIWRETPARAPGARSHKHHRQNTLISEPVRLSEDEFEMAVLIDDGCELMADHQTGQHLQGMILVEAARQAFLAVTEMYFLPQDGTKYYFVFDDLSARYRRFAFPIGAHLVYQVREKDQAANRQRFVIDVAVMQGGAEVATISGTFTAVKDARITRMEGAMARDVLAAHIEAVVAQRNAADVAEAA